MSWQPALDPKLGDTLSSDAIDMVIVPRARDLGGFSVRRALPSSQRQQMVGPFIFFDQMGPAEFLLGVGMDVRPHPHIGLSTVTYLFEGEIIHRGSPSGRCCRFRPGDPRPALPVYLAYNFFRIAAILQGIIGRVRDGTATSEFAPAKAAMVRPLADRAWDFARQA